MQPFNSVSPADGGPDTTSHHIGGAWSRLKVIGRLICRYPHIIIVPLAVLGLMLGLGIWGVQRGQAQITDQNRQSAQWEAVAAAQDVSSTLARAALPLRQVADLVLKRPNVPEVLKLWDTVSASWWLGTKGSSSLSRSIAVQGVIKRVDGPPGGEAFLEMDTLDLRNPFRDPTLYALTQDGLVLGGPFETELGPAVTFTFNIFVSGVDANETWGGNHEATACPPGICYRPATRTKMWGSVSTNFIFKSLLDESQFIQTLSLKGYSWQLMRPTNPMIGEPPGLIVPVLNVNDTLAPGHAVRVPMVALDKEWELAVWKGDTWQENMGYLYAIVVIGSVVVAGLLFAVLLSWVENRALLHSLLPKATIDRIRAEAQWVKSQEDEFKAIELVTPAQGLLAIISSNIAGVFPSLTQLLAMRDALQRSVDVYRPTVNAVQQRLEELCVDAEVQQALVTQLVGRKDSNEKNEETEGMAALVLKEARAIDDDDEVMVGRQALSPNDVLIKAQGSDNHAMDATGPSSRVMVLVDSKGEPLDSHSSTMIGLLQLGDTEMPLAYTATISHALPATLVEEDGNEDESQDMPGGNTGMYIKPAAVLLLELDSILATVDNWAFDAYAFDVAACGHPLSLLGYWLLQRTGLIKWANMDTGKLIRFLQQMESGYSRSNPYHNHRHASDVLQSMHVIMHRGGLMPNYVDQTTLLACYMAAVMHDYEHRGRNNDYLVNSEDELALTYNDRSPMENHHLAAAFKVLRRPDCDCLSNLPKSTKTKLRKTVIDLVLATDMKQHFAILGQFDALHGNSGSNNHTGRASSTAGSERSSIKVRDSVDLSRPVEHLAPLSDNDRLLSLQLAMKCADLGHLTAPLSVHLRWVKDLEEEFFLQGDAERTAGLTISPLCDRTKEGVFKSQVGFFDFVAMPLYKTFTNRFHAANSMRKAITKNQRYWQAAVAPRNSANPSDIGNRQFPTQQPSIRE